MRTITAALALCALVLVGATSAAAKEAQTGEQQLAELLDGRVPGAPQSCISTSRLINLQVIDKTALVYTDRDTVWVNRTVHPDTLNRDDVLVVNRTSGMQLCRLDQLTMVDREAGFYTGTVFLQDFVPYTKVPLNQ